MVDNGQIQPEWGGAGSGQWTGVSRAAAAIFREDANKMDILGEYY